MGASATDAPDAVAHRIDGTSAARRFGGPSAAHSLGGVFLVARGRLGLGASAAVSGSGAGSAGIEGGMRGGSAGVRGVIAAGVEGDGSVEPGAIGERGRIPPTPPVPGVSGRLGAPSGREVGIGPPPSARLRGAPGGSSDEPDPNGREPRGREPSGCDDPNGREPSGREPPANPVEPGPPVDGPAGPAAPPLGAAPGAPGGTAGPPAGGSPPEPASPPGVLNMRRGLRMKRPPRPPPPKPPPGPGPPAPRPNPPPGRPPWRGNARGPSGELRGAFCAASVRLPFLTASLTCSVLPSSFLFCSVSTASCPSWGSRKSTIANPRGFPFSSMARMISSTASPNGVKRGLIASIVVRGSRFPT